MRTWRLLRQRAFHVWCASLILVAGLAPAALSNLNEDLAEAFGLVPHPERPATGIPSVDAALEAAYARYAEARMLLDDLTASLGEPQTPAIYFWDFEFSDTAGDRIGGWGDWAPQGDAGWRRETGQPRIGGHRMSFASDNGFYPISGRGGESFLVSPRISLRSLPLPTGEDATAQANSQMDDARGTADDQLEGAPGLPLGFDATVDAARAAINGTSVPLATGTLADQGRILLYLTHRFNFAHDTTGEASYPGRDGGRLEIFTDGPPDLDRLQAGGEILRPLVASVPVDAGQPSVTIAAGSPFQPTQAFDGPSGGDASDAFSGWTDDTVDVFDLSPWAGQDAWIVLHAATAPAFSGPGAYFTNPDLFDRSVTHFGWAVQQLRIEGPAFLHNVRLDQIIAPAFTDGSDAYKVPPGPAQVTLLALNRGQVTELVRPAVSLSSPGAEPATCAGEAVPLKPGEVRPLTIPACGNLALGKTYAAQASLTLPDGTVDAYADNVQSFTVRATDSALVQQDGDVQVAPALSDETALREFKVGLRNPGFHVAHVTLTAKVEHDAGNGWNDVTNTASIVRFIGQEPTQVVAVPADPEDKANRYTATWPLQLQAAGNYRLTVDARQGAASLFTAQAGAGTLVAVPPPYSTQFATPSGAETALIVAGPTGSPWREWTSVATEDVRPPQCQDPGLGRVCPDSVWELPATVSARPGLPNGLHTPADYVLEARPQVDATRSGLLTSVTVDLQTFFQHLGCRPSAQENLCGGALADLGPAQVKLRLSSEANEPGAPPATEFPLQVIQWSFSGTNGRTPQSSPVNQFTYLDGQWIDGTYSVDLPFPLPASQADRLSLEFRLRLNGEAAATPAAADECPDVPDMPGQGPDPIESYCPTWRVAHVDMQGITADGQAIPLLGFHGGPISGNWQASVSPHDAAATCLAKSAAPCPGWHLRPTSTLSDSTAAAPWQHYSSIPNFLAADGLWFNSDLPPSSPIHYRAASGGPAGMLLSPAFRIPPASVEPNPRLRVQQLFNFATSSGTNSNVADATHDGGALMVRLLEETDDGLRPTSPFLPVALQATKQGQGHQVLSADGPHRFVGSDCHYYAKHPVLKLDGSVHPALDYGREDRNEAGCESAGLAGRPMASHPFDLGLLPVLDYTKVHASQAGNPDAAALQSLDLTGRLVQFAFKSETRDSPAVAAGVPAGWAIGGLSITNSLAPAYDIEVTEAELSAPYDWVTLGLGPSTEANLRLRLQNNGLFRASAIVVSLTMQADVPNAPPVTDLVETSLILGAGEADYLDVPVKIPPNPGVYRFVASADLTGEVLPGTPIIDAVANHCATVNFDGVATPGNVCSLENAKVLNVRAVEDLRVDLQVTPLAGREGFARTIGMAVHNEGNVVVENAKLRLFYRSVDGRDQRTQTWTILESPPPGQGAGWGDLKMDRPPESTLTLQRVSRYILQAAVFKAATPDTEPFEDIVQLQAASFETFYSDRFEPGSLTLLQGVAEGAMQPDDGWNQVSGLNMFEDSGTRAWHFGNHANGTVPANADSSLRLPTVDLTTASRAVLSFATRHDLETGFDGVRMEACLAAPEGSGCSGPWMALEPNGGYPGTVQADNPLNHPLPAERDPRRVASAFTGDSLHQFPLTDGWSIPEFELGQLPGLTTPVTVRRLDQEGFPRFEDRSPVRPDQATTYLRQWCEPGTASELYCWQRVNLNHRSPPPDPVGSADGKMWWSGGAAAGAAATQIELDVPDTNLAELAADETIRLRFWAWRDSAPNAPVTSNAGLPSQSFIVGVKFSGPTGPLAIPAKPVQTDPVTGWTLYEADYKGLGTIEFVRFTYRDAQPTSNGGNDPNRGAAMDDVRVQKIRHLSGGRTHVLSETTYPADDARWSNPTGTLPVRWQRVAAIPPTLDAWRPHPMPEGATVDGSPRVVWLFGNHSAPDEASRRYPRNAMERLQTPFLSLEEIGGTRASLVYWERYDLPARTLGFADARRIYVQALEPDLEGNDRPGPWMLLRAIEAQTALRSSGFDSQSTDGFCDRTRIQNDWCRAEIPLPSTLIGKQIRLAFEFESGRLPLTSPTYLDQELGYHWMLDQVALEADSIVGGRVHLRLHAGTDGSIGEGGWSVDNAQLVGFRYLRNAAILPDDQRGLVAPGTTIHLDGLVRNLASRLESEMVLEVRIDGLPNAAGDLPPFPAASFAGRGGISGAAESVQPLRSHPFSLAPAGQGQGAAADRHRFAIDVAVPDGCIECAYRVTFGLLVPGPDGLLEPLSDDVVGDHVRQLDIRVAHVDRLELRDVQIDPPTVAAGEAARVRFRIENTGTTVASAAPSLQATRALAAGPSSSVPAGSLAAINLAPGQSSDWLTFDWSTSEPGFYRLDLALRQTFGSGQSTQSVRAGHVMVGQLPLYHEDGFEAPGTWQATTAEPRNRAGQCDPGANAGLVPGSAPTEWQRIDTDAYEGTHSYAIGDRANPYPQGRDESVVGPWIDLWQLRDLQQGDGSASPFQPTLAFRYRSLLGEGNNGVIVQMAVRDAPGLERGPTSLEDGLPGQVRCGNPLVGDAVQPMLGANPVRRAFTGHDERPVWAVGTLPLSNLRLDAGPGSFDLVAVAGRQVQPSFRLGTGDGDALGFLVDSVTVSAYRAEVTPEVQHVDLRTGADKTFYFHVANVGAARDRFAVTIDPSQTSPEFLDGTIPVQVTPDLHLEAGKAATLAVRVTVPNRFDLPPLVGAQLAIQVASTVDPNQVATSTLRVDRLVRTPLPDLVVQLRTAAAGTDTLDEQQDPANLIVVVDNLGDAPSRKTDLVVLACRQSSTLADDIADCLAARQAGDEEDPAMPILLRSFAVPPLAPQTANDETWRFAPPLSWAPPKGSAGQWRLIAVADPGRTMRQYEPDDTVAVLNLTIRPLQRPDLVVEGLRLLLADGGPVGQVFAGDLVRIEGRVRNAGNQPATDVHAVLLAQFELRRERAATLAPGETMTIATTWQAQAGNFLVTLQAQTSSALDDLGNNVARIPLAVRQGTLDAAFHPGTLTLAPGDTALARLDVANRRSTDVVVLVEVQAAGGIRVVGTPERLTVPRGGLDQVPLSVIASPFAESGPSQVRLLLRTVEGGALVAQTVLQVDVADPARLLVTADPISGPPGLLSIPIQVRNDGSDSAVGSLTAATPGGWDILPMSVPLALAPGLEQTVEFQVHVPTSTPPGEHGLPLEFEGRLVGTATVRVTEAPAWTSTIEADRLTTSGQELVIRITNTGNAPGVPPLEQHGILVDPLPGTLAPGESAVFILRSLESQSPLRLPGQTTAAAFGATASPEPVSLEELKLSPPGGVREGQEVRVILTLRNPGVVVEPQVPLRVFVDDQLVATAIVAVEPGVHEGFEVPFLATRGPHIVTVVIGSEQPTGASLPYSAHEERALPDTGWLPLALLALILAYRRRSHP